MLRIGKDGKKKYRSLEIPVNPKFWDFQRNKPKPIYTTWNIFKRLSPPGNTISSLQR